MAHFHCETVAEEHLCKNLIVHVSCKVMPSAQYISVNIISD
jgi:hypothetical protein